MSDRTTNLVESYHAVAADLRRAAEQSTKAAQFLESMADELAKAKSSTPTSTTAAVTKARPASTNDCRPCSNQQDQKLYCVEHECYVGEDGKCPGKLDP